MTPIDKKITGYKVKSGEEEVVSPTSAPIMPKPSRPEILHGSTLGIAIPNSRKLFLTLNFLPDNTPWEIFINSKTVTHFQWVQAMTVTLSAAMQNGHVMELLAELKTIHDPATGGIWYKRKNYPSLIALIAHEIEQLCLAKKGEGVELPCSLEEPFAKSAQDLLPNTRYTVCPSCQAKTFRTDGGCSTCDSCGFSHCS